MTFTILEGNHYSNRFCYKLVNFFNFKRSLKYKVKFNSTGIYSLPEEDQMDINKLFGFSVGMHHTNSARFGWNCSGYKINLYSYCYINGERMSTFLRSIDIDKEYQLELVDAKDKYIFTVIRNSSKLTYTIAKPEIKSSISYNLWPYFGGNCPAPRNVDIQLKKV
jgi:hypothetical protein